MWLIELLGVFAFAFTGIIEARKKGMDVVGVYSVSMITAFGGGTVRDVLINHYPLYWVTHSSQAILLLLFAIAATPIATHVFENPRVTMVVLLFDALGLGLFSAVGANLAHQHGCDFFIATLFGVVTAVFGGIFRDIICNEIPNVFRRNELYASCSVVGSLTFLTCLAAGLATLPATLICIALTLLLRGLSLKYQIRLPF